MGLTMDDYLKVTLDETWDGWVVTGLEPGLLIVDHNIEDWVVMTSNDGGFYPYMVHRIQEFSPESTLYEVVDWQAKA